jgi:steroid delta-isomerase-like uncharacterized protein
MKKLCVVLPLALILCFLVGCQNKEAMAELEQLRAQAAVEEQNKDVVKRYWIGKWNDRRIETLDELQTPDVQYHGTDLQINGLEEYKQVYSVFASALHDTKVTIEEMIAEGDKVMTRINGRATHKGELMGIAPTGKTVTWSQFTVFRLVDGKIAEEWEIFDELGMMTQLGMELKPKEGE